MKKIKTLGQKSLLLRAFATISAVAMCVVLASCGENSDNNNLTDENAQTTIVGDIHGSMADFT